MPAGDQPKAQPPPEPTLLEMARKKFTTLSQAEEELFQAAQEGRAASALTSNEEEDNPASAANWSANRVVRAECIAWLCTDPQGSALVTYRGVELHGMRIETDLNLNHADIKFSLTAWKCAFSGNVLLQDAQFQGLYFAGCHTKGLSAGRAKMGGAVFLRHCKVESEVNLVGATISGDLVCIGAQLSNVNGKALNVDGAKIEGSVFSVMDLRLRARSDCRVQQSADNWIASARTS